MSIGWLWALGGVIVFNGDIVKALASRATGREPVCAVVEPFRRSWALGVSGALGLC